MQPLSMAAISLSAALTAAPVFAQTPEAPPPLLDTPAMESQPPPSAPPPPPAAPVPPSYALPPPVRLVHDGFYMAVSAGFAEVSVSGDGPNGSASLSGLGSSTGVALGGTPARGLAIAGVLRWVSKSGTFSGGPLVTATTTREVNGVMTTSQSTLSGRAQAASFLLGVQADWFPRPEDGWHVGAGLGLGGTTVADDAGGTNSGIGLSGSVFGGYQWWIGPRWSMGLQAVVLGAPRLKLSDSNGADTGYRMTPWSFGIEGTILYY
jgi:hypothetical protein